MACLYSLHYSKIFSWNTPLPPFWTGGTEQITQCCSKQPSLLQKMIKFPVMSRKLLDGQKMVDHKQREGHVSNNTVWTHLCPYKDTEKANSLSYHTLPLVTKNHGDFSLLRISSAVDSTAGTSWTPPNSIQFNSHTIYKKIASDPRSWGHSPTKLPAFQMPITNSDYGCGSGQSAINQNSH